MKPTQFVHIAILAGLSTAIASAQPEAGGQNRMLRDVPTNEALMNRLRETQEMNPLANHKAVEPEEATEVYRPKSLIENSDIISFNGLTTLVPKGAILAIPDSLNHRIGNHVAGNRVVNWSEFLQANRGWVMQVEVTRDQAHGRTSLPEAVLERKSKTTSLMVATFQGGPIAVLPPKPEETDEARSAEDGGAGNL